MIIDRKMQYQTQTYQEKKDKDSSRFTNHPGLVVIGLVLHNGHSQLCCVTCCQAPELTLVLMIPDK